LCGIVIVREAPKKFCQTLETLLIQEGKPTANSLLNTPGVALKICNRGTKRGSNPRRRLPHSQRLRMLRQGEILRPTNEDRLFFIKLHRAYSLTETAFRKDGADRGLRIALQKPFEHAYRDEKARLTQDGSMSTIGPMHLHSGKLCLNICYAAERPLLMDWGAFLAAHGHRIDFCFVIFTMMNFLTSPIRRSRAQGSIATYASLHGLCVGTSLCLKIVLPHWQQAMKRHIRHTLAPLRRMFLLPGGIGANAVGPCPCPKLPFGGNQCPTHRQDIQHQASGGCYTRASGEHYAWQRHASYSV
jgi:hypothetical protein